MPRLIRVAATASLAVVILVCGTSPASARSTEARSAVETFIAAMNTGDPEVAAGVFAVEGFSWFSEAPYRVDPAARQRDTDSFRRVSNMWRSTIWWWLGFDKAEGLGVLVDAIPVAHDRTAPDTAARGVSHLFKRTSSSFAILV